jgi:Rrf2 family transcriptional regulator, cysteine metabolism repressor
MQFSKRSEYGVRVMTELAVRYGSGAVSLTEIARDEAMPLPYLEQIMTLLRRAGLVTSYQGVRGGYELSRPPTEIVMSDVLDVLEGNLAPMLCAPLDGATSLCGRESMCGSKELWRRVRDAVAEALRATTLAELVPERLPYRRFRPQLTPLPVLAGPRSGTGEPVATS